MIARATLPQWASSLPDMTKELWLQQTLKPGERYGGLLLGRNGEPDQHLIVIGSTAQLNYSDACKWAAISGGVIPSVRELLHLYLNVPDVFNDEKKAQFWTRDVAPEPRNHSDMGGKKNEAFRWVVSPHALHENTQDRFRSQSTTYAYPEVCEFDVLRVRKIDLAGQPVLVSDEGSDDWLLQIHEQLKELKFKCEIAGPLTTAALQRYPNLVWTGAIGKYRYSLSLNSTRSGPFTTPAWSGMVYWNIHLTPRGSLGSFHTKKGGEALAGPELAKAILAGLESLKDARW